jgi:hypothetical protein
MLTDITNLAALIADDRAIGNDELVIAIDHLNKALRAALASNAEPPADTLRVKQVLEHIALQRRLSVY